MNKLGFALAQDVLEAVPFNARGGFWGTRHAYPSNGTGEMWQVKQPPQPCEMSPCGSVLVAVSIPSDLWLWTPVMPAALWYMAQVAWWVIPARGQAVQGREGVRSCRAAASRLAKSTCK